MSAKSFPTKQTAIEAGYMFIDGKAMYERDMAGTLCKIQRVDVSGGNSFGYNFSLAAYRQDEIHGWKRIGLFGSTIDLWIEQATNKGGGIGAVYTNVMAVSDYDNTISQACEALGIETANE